MRIVIVDYGMGNLRSVEKAFRRLGRDAIVSSDPAAISAADRLVLPGVGHFARGMENLRPLVPILEERVLRARVPLLGICLGLQLLTRRSEEGDCAGLGWLDAETVRLRGSLKVPHFGWNTVDRVATAGLVGEGTSFYFAHSYHLAGCPPADVAGWTSYGVEFPSVIRKGNLVGTQFHPEKSHRRGLAFLESFLCTDRA
jgi:imidazole glycerol-phosphate synthase subunit HisH